MANPVQINNPDILVLTETWLDNSHADAEITIQGYETLRKDRKPDPNRGGVCVYIRDSLPAEEITIAEHDEDCNCETLWIKIQGGPADSLLRQSTKKLVNLPKCR